MKPESDPVLCPDCGEEVLNHHDATITPVGVYHGGCDKPNPGDL